MLVLLLVLCLKNLLEMLELTCKSFIAPFLETAVQLFLAFLPLMTLPLLSILSLALEALVLPFSMNLLSLTTLLVLLLPSMSLV